MKYRKTFREAWDDVRKSSVSEAKEKEKQDSDEVRKLKDEIQQLKVKYNQAKIDKSAPIPNPDTGEVSLRTGFAQAILDKKGPKPDAAKAKKEKVKLSSGQSKIEVNPDVSIGQISGGNKASTGNLH